MGQNCGLRAEGAPVFSGQSFLWCVEDRACGLISAQDPSSAYTYVILFSPASNLAAQLWCATHLARWRVEMKIYKDTGIASGDQNLVSGIRQTYDSDLRHDVVKASLGI